MISAKFLWRNVFFGGKLQIYAKILILKFLRAPSIWNLWVPGMPLTTEFICKISFTQVDTCHLLRKLQPWLKLSIVLALDFTYYVLFCFFFSYRIKKKKSCPQKAGLKVSLCSLVCFFFANHLCSFNMLALATE